MGRKTVAVIGAGPIGLECALALATLEYKVTVVDCGADVGHHVSQWGHVRLFSPMKMNMSELGVKCVGRSIDGESFLTGSEYINQYLKPLAKHLAGKHVDFRWNEMAVAISRETLPKGCIGQSKRVQERFRVLLENMSTGKEKCLFADYVVDATGTYGPNTAKHFGPAGAPAIGERGMRLNRSAILHRTIPDILGKQRGEFTSNQTLSVAVVGAGYSAATALQGLYALAQEEPKMNVKVTWITKTDEGEAPYALVEGDPLPARDAISRFGNELVVPESNVKNFAVQYLPNSTITQVVDRGSKADITVSSSPSSIQVDCILSLVGYKPDYSFLSELQVHRCWASDGPMKLAAALLAASGNGGDCMAQVVPGAETLLNPEPNLYIIGAKSYGRGSAFLLRVGLEQVEHVVQLIQSGK